MSWSSHKLKRSVSASLAGEDDERRVGRMRMDQWCVGVGGLSRLRTPITSTEFNIIARSAYGDRHESGSMQTLRARCRWVPHERMVVDALTKRHGNSVTMLRLMRDGVLSIVDEDQ